MFSTASELGLIEQNEQNVNFIDCGEQLLAISDFYPLISIQYSISKKARGCAYY